LLSQPDEDLFNPDYVEVDRILEVAHTKDPDTGEVSGCTACSPCGGREAGQGARTHSMRHVLSLSALSPVPRDPWAQGWVGGRWPSLWLALPRSLRCTLGLGGREPCAVSEPVSPRRRR